MAALDINSSTTTSLTGSYSNYSVSAETLDSPDTYGKETWYDFPNASEYLGYYKKIPELKKAIDALAIWTVGKGFQTNTHTRAIFDFIKGWGEDTIENIFWNLMVQKKVFGDAFAEIIRENNQIINIKPLNTADMRIVTNTKGIIIRYEQRTRKKGGYNKRYEPYEILHLSNDRIGNEIHGTSVIESCKWVIDARNEAMTDYRVVLHRNRIPVRIIEIDTDDPTKRNTLINQYEEAIKKGEVLVIPKGTVEFKDESIAIQDPIAWIQYLEGFFYQAVGIPRVIASSQEYSEASSKVGYLTFEPVYTWEQTQLEADLFSQLGFRVKFNRPPSLGSFMQESESKNTGQTGFQPNEVNVSATRTE